MCNEQNTCCIGGGLAIAIAQSDAGIFTGCLTQGGTLVKVAIGDQPAQPCSIGQTEVRWNSQGQSSGDDRPTLYNHLCNEILLPGETAIDVMALEVPAGSWVAYISIQAGPLGPCGDDGHPLQGQTLSGDYDCTLLVGAQPTGGHPASSRTGEFRTLAWSQPFLVEQETTVAVSCQLFEGSDPDGATLSVGDFGVTPVNAWQMQP